jgi:hypothetical protein
MYGYAEAQIGRCADVKICRYEVVRITGFEGTYMTIFALFILFLKSICISAYFHIRTSK